MTMLTVRSASGSSIWPWAAWMVAAIAGCSALAMATPLAAEPGVVLFLGDSLTAGLGVNPELAFPALIQGRIEAAGLEFRAVNAGNSGETSAGGLRRVQWLLRQPVEILVLELGANDGLRGTDLNSTRANLQAIIDATRDRYPDVEIILAGMQVPPNLGPQYTHLFRALYPELAEANQAHLIPFLLAGVAGDPELNQPDGIHPTAEGHAILAANVWSVLEPVLRTRQARRGKPSTARAEPGPPARGAVARR